MNRMKQLIGVPLLVLILGVATASAGVKTGAEAPGFTLKDPTGKEVSLSDYDGKYVVLEWVNPGCPFVQKFYDVGEMQRLQREAQDKDVVWLSINSTTPKHGDYMSPEASVEYYKDKDVASIWLMDPDGKVGKAYGAARTPHMFVINPEGKIVYQGAIDSISSADPGDISKADNYVIMALKSSMDGKSVSMDTTRPYGCSIKY